MLALVFNETVIRILYKSLFIRRIGVSYCVRKFLFKSKICKLMKPRIIPVAIFLFSLAMVPYAYSQDQPAEYEDEEGEMEMGTDSPEESEGRQRFTISPRDVDSTNETVDSTYYYYSEEEQKYVKETPDDPETPEIEEESYTIAPNEPAYETQNIPQKTRRNSEGQTLTRNVRHVGGYGGLAFKVTRFNDEYLAMLGLRTAWVIDRSVGIGLDIYGFIPSTTYSGIDSVYSTRVVGGYGGFNIEPILFSNKVVHVTFPVSTGAGWMGYLIDWEEVDYEYEERDLVDHDVFWYVEPGMSLELNVTRFFRVNLGASYRFTEDFDLVNTRANAFSDWNYNLTLKFGRF